MNKPVTYEIRQLDCYWYDDQWEVNTSYLIGEFTTRAKNEKQAISKFLAKNGIHFYPAKVRYLYNGSGYDIVDRETEEPIFIALERIE